MIPDSLSFRHSWSGVRPLTAASVEPAGVGHPVTPRCCGGMQLSRIFLKKHSMFKRLRFIPLLVFVYLLGRSLGRLLRVFVVADRELRERFLRRYAAPRVVRAIPTPDHWRGRRGGG